MIQGYHDPAGGPRRSVRGFTTYNLTAPAGQYGPRLRPRSDMLCRAPRIERARLGGRLQAARLTSGEQRARVVGPYRTLDTIS